MRTFAKAFLCGSCLLVGFAVLFFAASTARALHRESPPVVRITSAADHQMPTGRSFGNWFAFASDQDLANEGGLRAPGAQIFVWNQGFFDCAQGTTKDTCGTDQTTGCQRTPCPPPGTPFLRQVTNTTTGNPANPSMGTAASGHDVNDVWVAFDALGSFICLPTDTVCLGRPSSSRRQIFMLNLLTNEIRQITFGSDGDSTHPSTTKLGATVTFESTATTIDGFPNPARVTNVFVCKVNVTGNPAQPATQCRQLSVGPAPARIIPQGPSTLPFPNENGTAVAWESTADILGSGLDTGVKQIYYATFDQQDFFRHLAEAQIFRVTNGNGPSQHPFLGSTLVTNPTPGASNQKKILLFSSTATNLPGSQMTAGSQIYKVQTDLLTQAPGAPPPVVPVEHLTTTVPFGNCDWPTVDPGGLRYGFVCDGDPLKNGTTGNRAFALSTGSRDNTLFQLTGSGDIAGPVANNIGQWFMVLATTSDLTGSGSCGHQIYVIDFTAGKWPAATNLGQLPPDVTPQSPNSRIGLRTFSILPAGSAAGVSTTTVTSLAGKTTANVPRTLNPVDQGLIGMNIGGPDLFTLQAQIAVSQSRIKLPPVLVPGFGAICMTATGDGSGSIDCNGGELDNNITLTQDHDSDTSNSIPVFDCNEGCRENQTCFPPAFPYPRASYPGPYQSLCPVCVFTPTPNSPPPTSGLCSAGPFKGLTCKTDLDCRPGITCDSNDNLISMCKGPVSLTTAGTFAAGDLTLTLPIQITLSQSPGLDGEFCTGDTGEVFVNIPPLPSVLYLTTATATGTILDADPLLSATGGPTLGQTLTATLTGAPFDCGHLRSGDLGGARLVAELPILNLPNVPGLHDVLVGLNLVPDPNPLSSCDPFCLTDATCNDGNPCNGTETCNTTTSRCTPGTPLCPGDGNVCDGTPTCDPTTATCGPATPLNCNDNNPCTADSCDAALGCINNPTPLNGTTCTPSNTCQQNGVCQNGTCTGTPVANGTACNDNNACTQNDACTNGNCAGTPVNCGDVCAGNTCNPATGCVTGPPLNCNDNNPCTADSCDPVAGCINNRTSLNGTTCNDGSACTTGDVCTNGTCTGTPVNCSDNNACNGQEVCLPATGCAAGTPLNCDDNNVCNGIETCNPATGCVAGTPLNCDDNNPCTTDTCDPRGGCKRSPVPNGTSCGNACTDSCQGGSCTPGTPPNCDDNNPCTDDTCDPEKGCVHTNNTAACNDSNACTTGDVCTNGTCTGTPVNCSDNNVCNGIETCNPATGCVAGTPLNCNAGDVCTTDTCDSVLGCQNNTTPEAYLLCRVNVLVTDINNTPASELGGFKKKQKQKYLTLANGALKRLQKALAGSPHQRAISLRIAQQNLSRLNNRLKKAMNGKQIHVTIGDGLLNDVSKASLAIQAIPKPVVRR